MPRRHVGPPRELQVQSSNAARTRNPDDFQDKVEIRAKFNALLEYVQQEIERLDILIGGNAEGPDVTDGTTTVVAPPVIDFDGGDFSVVDAGGTAEVSLIVTPTPTSRAINTTEGVQGGGDLSIDRTHKLDISGLTEDTSPVPANDFVATYDASATTHKKVKISNLHGTNVTDGTTTVSNVPEIEFDPDFFDVTDNSGDAAVTFVGESGGVDVTDGTTDVVAPDEIQFDPAWFDVTDNSGDAAVTLVTAPIQGNIWPVRSPPAVSQWTWVNQGGATATDDSNGAVTISKTSEGGATQIRSFVKALDSSSDFDIMAGFISGVAPLQNSDTLLILRESGTGKMLVSGIGLPAGGTTIQHYVARMTNNTTFGAVVWNPTGHDAFAQLSPFYMRYVRTGGGATIACSVSLDGRHWHQVVTDTVSLIFTTAPDQFGFGVNAFGGNIHATMFSLEGSEWP